ncbi:hypothetical protein BD769DRAFT_1386929 [Suillus cothurnatus]|nr:hypothetical protein BD769DRAFT_1386929 [Suillus cothurnatus]
MALHNTHIHSCTGKASTHKNAERALDVFTSGNNTVRIQPDIQINSFANRSGFHPSVIQDIYKNVLKAMHIAAMELAKFKIQQLRIQRLQENSDLEDLYERPDRAKVKMELKDSDSEDLYERPEKRPEKAKARTEPKEEENN